MKGASVKGILVYRCFLLQQLISRVISSLLMRGYGWLWGLEFPGPACFYGLARFVRHPQGRMLDRKSVV